MSLAEEARKRAADLADSAQTTTEPVHRDVLTSLRNLWIAIAEEANSEDEAAEIDRINRILSDLAPGRGRLH
jgi:hypothetical protein